jgi:hypothetical protein
MVKIVIVDMKCGCTTTDVKEFAEDTLFKKCKFRKSDDFSKQHTWAVTMHSIKHNISLYARTAGKHNMVNKFEFPPPVDTVLFYGCCALVNYDNDNNVKDLDRELWVKIYERLFGGFDNLNDSAIDDINEIDELDNVASKYKTKEGFLKDGFVVDNVSDSVNSSNDKNESELNSNDDDDDDGDDADDDSSEFNGSELSPEEYSYASSDA